MPRIPYPDTTTLPEDVQKILAGTPLNVVRMGAHASPALFKAQGQLSYAIADPQALDPRQRETAILRVGHLCNSAYELHHHTALARAIGLSEAEITAIGSGDYARLDPLLAAVARFTDEVVRDVSPSDAALAALRGHVSDETLINLVLTIGCYLSVARLIAVTGIAPDEEALQHLATGVDDPAL